MTRDGSKTYKNAILDVSSKIRQVSDRWHIFQRLFEATKKKVNALIPKEWTVEMDEMQPAGKEVSEAPPVVPERVRQREMNAEKRWLRIQEVQNLCAEGLSERKIADRLGISRGTVATYKKN